MGLWEGRVAVMAGAGSSMAKASVKVWHGGAQMR